MVDAYQLAVRGLARRPEVPAASRPARGHDLHGLGALRAFGVTGRRDVVRKQIRGNEDERHAVSW
jgi:hypothetical protein